MMRAAILPLILLPAACGTIPVRQAETECREPAQAVAPRGTVGIGIGSGGRVSGGVGVSLSGDLRSGRRADESFAACVIRKSGEPPFLVPGAAG